MALLQGRVIYLLLIYKRLPECCDKRWTWQLIKGTIKITKTETKSINTENMINTLTGKDTKNAVFPQTPDNSISSEREKSQPVLQRLTFLYINMLKYEIQSGRHQLPSRFKRGSSQLNSTSDCTRILPNTTVLLTAEVHTPWASSSRLCLHVLKIGSGTLKVVYVPTSLYI